MEAYISKKKLHQQATNNLDTGLISLEMKKELKKVGKKITKDHERLKNQDKLNYTKEEKEDKITEKHHKTVETH